ncbi:MAG: M23 family metallopeptidase [Labilithrix sp.]|nr:M23 family metallopeptidase [Labilithrix sp.]
MPPTGRLPLREVLGVEPLGLRLREAWLALRGDDTTPKSRFDHTSLRVLQPRLALPAWLGRRPADRRVPILNLFSHVQPPASQGWSVRVTTARDFRDLRGTYDSHNGTDFVVPPGTRVLAPAPGRVVRVSSEFNRGGLKVVIDHGRGLVTTSNHLARALVRVGDRVARGDVVALSGMSGVDGLLAFPWNAPHVHFNTWVGGVAVDPFAAAPGEASLWRNGNDPTPYDGARVDGDDAPPSRFSPDAVARALDACSHDASRAEILAGGDVAGRAVAAMFHMNYYPTRFRERVDVYADRFTREARLDLPLSREDYDGVAFPSPRRSRVR